jgi:hypothetical protein
MAAEEARPDYLEELHLSTLSSSVVYFLCFYVVPEGHP